MLSLPALSLCQAAHWLAACAPITLVAHCNQVLPSWGAISTCTLQSHLLPLEMQQLLVSYETLHYSLSRSTVEYLWNSPPCHVVYLSLSARLVDLRTNRASTKFYLKILIQWITFHLGRQGGEGQNCSEYILKSDIIWRIEWLVSILLFTRLIIYII